MKVEDPALRPFWRELPPATRSTYQNGWRKWLAYCSAVGVAPLKASVPEAQAWVDSMRLKPLSTNYIATLVQGARMTTEYLAMVGYQPYEPFRMVELPRIVRRGPAKRRGTRVALSDTLLGKALYQTRTDDRAHGILWACAGMGLAAADLTNVTPSRIKRIGDTSVLVVPRAGRGHLVPVPRELLMVIERYGWPVPASTSKSAGVLVGRALTPYISTNMNALRQWHRQRAFDLGVDDDRIEAGLVNHRSEGLTRLQYKTHSAVVVCAHLRALLLDSIPT